MSFRTLPEYIIEDVVNYLFFVTQCVPFSIAHLQQSLTFDIFTHAQSNIGQNVTREV